MSDTPAKSALENKLDSLDAVYQRFGRDGLKDTPISDLTMLLAAKQLELRDRPRSHSVSEQQKEANRLLELEIRDLTGLMNAQLAGAGLNTLQRFVSNQPSHSYEKPKTKDFDRER